MQHYYWLIKLFDWFLIIAGGAVTFFVLEPSKNFPPYGDFMPQGYLNVLGKPETLKQVVFSIGLARMMERVFC